MDFHPHGFVNDGLGWLYGLFWLLIVVAIVAGVFLIVRLVLEQPRSRGWPGSTPANAAALAELDLRYARGEVDRADYLQRRADLLGLPGPEHTALPHAGPTRPAKP
jgi:putative membrane protein